VKKTELILHAFKVP